MSSFQKKIMRHEKKQESMSETLEVGVCGGEAGNRNCFWEWPDVTFIRKSLEVAIRNIFTELMETMMKGVKESVMKMLHRECQ